MTDRKYQMNAFRAVLCASLLACCIGARASGDDVVELRVDTGNAGPRVDRHIFGQFTEHLGHGIYEGIWVGPDSAIPNTRGIRNDVVRALKALKVPVVRWPGGCFADQYHWRKGIGPRESRPAGLNPDWGNVLEPNTFGTHEFFDFIQQIGAEAYVSVNVGSGTPQEAAEWLEYMTAGLPTSLAKERAANGHPDPYAVSYLGIGNESWGCGGTMSPDYYVSQLRIYSRYARNYNSAVKMQRIAVGPDGADTAYTEAVMKAWQAKIWSWDMEGLSLHAYTVGKWPPSYRATGFGADEYASLVREGLKMEDLIRTHAAIMDKYDPGKKVSLAVDEWGVWLAATPGTNPAFLQQQNSQRDAIIAALTLNIFARHADRVRMANIAQMVNVLQAMIFTDRERMVLTPTYHVFRMYVPFQDGTFIPVSFDRGSYVNGAVSLPRLDAVAVRSTDGTLWIALVNVDPEHRVDVHVDGVDMKHISGETLTSARVDSVNSFSEPANVSPTPLKISSAHGKRVLRLEPHSITVVSLGK